MLTQLSTVKARLRIDDSDVHDDVLLTNFINWVSARFENDCNRSFAYAIYSDEFEGDETELRVKAHPILSVTSISIKSNETDGFVAQTAPDYVIRKKSLVSLRARIGTVEDVLQIVYTGGYILPGGAPVTNVPNLPDDLQFAAVEQIAYFYQNKDRLGIVALSGEGGSISQFAKLDLLSTVQATLDKYERWMP